MTRLFSAAVAAALTAVCSLSSPASAHVVADPNSGAAGGYFKTSLRVSHGCDGAATAAVRIKVPDGILSIRPQLKPGWQIQITMRKLDKPADAGHGKTITEVVDEIIWQGGPLPDNSFDEFGLMMKLPAKAGETLYLPVVQECVGGGALRWVEIPAATQKWGDLKEPAPFVTLTTPGGHSH